MSKQEWTQESDWLLGGERCLTGPESIRIRKDPLVSSVAYFGTKANAQRAYDCVMACKGIDSPAEYISSLRQENERLRELARAVHAYRLGYNDDEFMHLNGGAKGLRLNVWRELERCGFDDAYNRQALTKEG